MGYQFRIMPHTVALGQEVIEVWRDGEFVAAIYPHEDGIRVVSKHMTAVYKEDEPAGHGGQWLPAAIIKFNK